MTKKTRLSFIALIISVFLMITLFCGCLSSGTTAQQPGGKLKMSTNDSQSKIMGKVVYQNNQMIPDSKECEIIYFDNKTNANVTLTVIKGNFYLDNLSDGNYKLTAATKDGSLTGTAYLTVKNGRPAGSKSSDDFIRIILGIKNLKEAPQTPGLQKGKYDEFGGIILDK